MPKKKKSGKKHPSSNLADITINDFANSTVSKNRLKKSTANVTKVLKKIEEEKSWDEKTEGDDFEGEFVEQVNDDGTVSYVLLQKPENRRRRKTLSNSSDSNETGSEYSIDIWFLISEYIRPEDVGRFAGICRATYEVVCSAKFWFHLYKRYYTDVPNLPEQLKPVFLSRKYGLKSLVIKALYFMYKPFINRIKSIDQCHISTLKRQKCISMWYERNTERILYYFKMKSNHFYYNNNNETDTDYQNLLDKLDDVCANNEEGCCILQLTCRDLHVLPPVLGLTLTSVATTSSSGMFSGPGLRLGFGSEIQCLSSSKGGNASTIIHLEPVINVKVINWWHPLYPFTHNIEPLLNRE